MGHQIIKQPDGKYLIWSSVVDDIIVFDADREEVIEYYAERAANDSRRSTERWLDEVDEGWEAGIRRMAFDEIAGRLDEVREQHSGGKSND